MHADRCIRSDGDWLCAAGCTHYRDEAAAEFSVTACAVADAWTVLKQQIARGDAEYYGPLSRPNTPLRVALNRLEELTRNNPARKASK